MNNKFKIFILLSSLCLGLIAVGCSKKIDNSNNAATINGKVITKQSLEREVERVRNRFANATNSNQQEGTIQKDILEIMIGGELLYQGSEKSNISVTSEEIQEDLVKTNKAFSDVENFTNKFTADEIGRKLAIEKFITKEFADTTIITDEDGMKFYKENLDDFTRPEKIIASHILIKSKLDGSDDDKQIALTKIKEIQAKLQTDSSFAELAKEFSEDKTATDSGSLGVVIRGQMVEPFEQAAFALEPGQISDIVVTEFGYHLITISDKQPTVVIPYEEIKDKLKGYLRQRAINSKIENFIKEKRHQAAIEFFI